jgi:hypothetical protein
MDENMRKIPLIVCGFLLATLISVSMISPAQASIEQFTWLPPYVYRGYDNLFYQTDIVGYKTGTTAQLSVPVYNDWWGYKPVNVSAVKVEFDWNINYTSAEASLANPIQIPPYQRRAFTISFTVPSTTVASNLLAHTYKIYVEHVNATTGPKKIVDTWTAQWSNWYPKYKLAVYSSDQADAYDSRQMLEAYYYDYYPTYTFAETRELMVQSRFEQRLGELRYTAGNFTGAKTHYQKALELRKEAISTDVNKMSTVEDTLMSLANSLRDIADSYRNVMWMQGITFLLASLGFLLLCLGCVTYLIRKSKMPQPTTR